MANTEQTQQHLWTLSPNVVPGRLFLFLQVIYVYYGFRFCVFTELLCANMYTRVYLCLLAFLLGFSPLSCPISNLLSSYHSSFRCPFSKERGSLQVGDVMAGSVFERETLPGERPRRDSGPCPTC